MTTPVLLLVCSQDVCATEEQACGTQHTPTIVQLETSNFLDVRQGRAPFEPQLHQLQIQRQHILEQTYSSAQGLPILRYDPQSAEV